MGRVVIAALLVFPVRYFDFLGEASAHRLVPSLVGAGRGLSGHGPAVPRPRVRLAVDYLGGRRIEVTDGDGPAIQIKVTDRPWS